MMNVSTFLHFFRSYGLFISILIGCCCPFLHGFGEQYLAYFIMLMLFFVFVGLHAPLHALRWSHLSLLTWNFGFPCAAFWILKMFGLSTDLAMGAFMCAITPTGTSAPVVMTFLDGNREYVVLGFLLTTLVFTFTLPFLFPAFYGIATPGLSLLILKKVAGVVFIPMAAAILCRLCYPKSQGWTAKAKNFSFLLWQCVIIFICSKMSYSITENQAMLHQIPAVFLIAAGVCALNFVAGRFLGGKSFSRECSQTLGQKNCGLTILVVLMYASPLVALAPSLYIICHNVWNAIQISVYEKRNQPSSKPKTAVQPAFAVSETSRRCDLAYYNIKKSPQSFQTNFFFTEKSFSMNKCFCERIRILITWLFALGMFSFVAVSGTFWTRYPLIEEGLFAAACLCAGIGALGRAWCAVFISGRKDGTLVKLGPYAMCRNPLYFFSMIGALGIGLATETLLVPLCVMTAFLFYYPVVIRREEKRLALIFGEDFRSYQQEVPCFFPKFSLLKEHEPSDYPVQTKTVRHCLCEVVWFIWLIGIIEVLSTVREAGFLPVQWLIF